MSPAPFSVSSSRCTWQFCSANADLSLYKQQVQLCREHALFVWATINNEMVEHGMSNEEVFARAKKEKQEREQTRQKIQKELATVGEVYYLKIGAHIKIGFTTNMPNRMHSYPPGTEILAVEYGDLSLERKRHRDFADLRAAGREWYRPESRLLDHINQVAENLNHLEYTEYRKRTITPPGEVQHARMRGSAGLGYVG